MQVFFFPFLYFFSFYFVFGHCNNNLLRFIGLKILGKYNLAFINIYDVSFKLWERGDAESPSLRVPDKERYRPRPGARRVHTSTARNLEYGHLRVYKALYYYYYYYVA